MNLIVLVIFFVIVMLITNHQEIKETFTNTLGLQNTYTNIEDAIHGVAIGKDHFYAINTNSISKHDLHHGNLIKQIKLSDHPRIHHLNDAIMVGKNLFVTNRTENKKNTIEVFNDDLVYQYHINVLGNSGVLTWIDYFQKTWWGCFAHIEDKIQYTVVVEFYTSGGIIGDANSLISQETNKFEKKDGNIDKERNSDLIQDTVNVQWGIRNRWYFPSELYEKMNPFSCTGGSFDSKGRLYVTGNKDEIIILNLYSTSILMSLDYIQETKENVQCVSWDRKNNILYAVGNKSVFVYKNM